MPTLSGPWTLSPSAYRALGQMYVQDERFRANIGGGNDAAVELLRAAIAIYSEGMSGPGGSGG